MDLGHGKGKDKCGCGDDHKGGGDVSQTNIAAALGIAFNANSTDQSVEQVAGDSCKCHGGGVQAALQKAFNHQDADAEANAFQFGASNANSARRRLRAPGQPGARAGALRQQELDGTGGEPVTALMRR